MINQVLGVAQTIAEHLQKCACMKSLKQIHAQIFRHGLIRDNLLAVKLVAFCSKASGDIDYARLVFNWTIDTANVFLWTAMITGYAKNQSQVTKEAIMLYKQMHQHGVPPNSFTFSSSLKACSFLVASNEGRQIQSQAFKLGLDADIYVQTTLVDMYAKFGCIEAARQLFDSMQERNLVVWNAMLVGYSKSGWVAAARALFDEMPERDSISWTAMITGYTNRGDMWAAQALFDQMSNREVVTSWNALIAGYSHCGELIEALGLFDLMLAENVKPNQVTMAIVISVCGQLGALVRARWVHEYVKASGLEMNVYVYNSLIDMYGKCGSLDEAYKVFCEIPMKDTVSYNAMIVGLANHGYGNDALKLFLELQNIGLWPDRITFIGVLTACSHTGLVREGREYFECMTKVYEIEPSVDHYACMVDLLGRAGCVEEAHKVVEGMAVVPHAGVWGALLSACGIHGNLEVAEIAAKNLFEIEPGNPGNYVLLSNIYARARRWDDVAKVRRLMRGKGVAKTAGCSWIEVNNEVYKFLIGDTTHPISHYIYSTLRQLSLHLMFVGYESDFGSKAHDYLS
ncbi:hypothetical protein AMTRI_Chr10g8480 [Amborella trichopoda]|uniref:pentatricopeptide repeat-containing protein At3g29230 n=1 Tax=Amborella trichopoda TaxID=13333 RepID=UPI0005D3AA24|nr:pentatricopeptide repeat-containing protein At3g29230 [Amborella trichopoda]|eukprot:XP_011628208.2 pentatricopeptide repeat-containing protein At3g29230 [Amborella trichopoda]